MLSQARDAIGQYTNGLFEFMIRNVRLRSMECGVLGALGLTTRLAFRSKHLPLFPQKNPPRRRLFPLHRGIYLGGCSATFGMSKQTALPKSQAHESSTIFRPGRNASDRFLQEERYA